MTKKFEDNLSNTGDFFVKKGSSVPKDAVQLAWFSKPELTPGNNLVFLDTAESIKENSNQMESDTILMYADENGVLRHLDGSNAIHSNEVAVSDLPLNIDEETSPIPPAVFNQSTGLYDITRFVFGYYVSSNFVSGIKGHSLPVINYGGKNRYLLTEDNADKAAFNRYGIKVLDKDDNHYTDENGVRRYKILLEPFSKGESPSEDSGLYRIIVLLDTDTPSGLKLQYDKVEIDSSYQILNYNYGYKEIINQLPLFKEYPEETLVTDPMSKFDKVFSIKQNNLKETKILGSEATYDASKVIGGYKVFTPRKAFYDDRKYEAFNWRIIGKVFQDVNFESDAADNDKKVKVGVVLSDPDQIKAKVAVAAFNRLNKSVINGNNYNFVNPYPLDRTVAKSNRKHWLIDIDNLTPEQLKDYDLIVLAINDEAAYITKFNKLKKYVYSYGGCVLVDMHYGGQLTESGQTAMMRRLGNLDESFTLVRMSKETKSDVASKGIYINNNHTEIVDPPGGWNLSTVATNSVNYNFFGQIRPMWSLRPVDSVTVKNVDIFNRMIAKITDTKKVLLAHMPVDTTSDASSVTKGHFFISSCEMMNQASKIVQNGITIDNSSDEDSLEFSPIAVEGVLKFLYNVAIFSLKNRYRTRVTQVQTAEPAAYYHSTRWFSSWTLNGYTENLLTADERTTNNFAFTSNLPNGKAGFYRTISSSSILDLFKEDYARVSKSNYRPELISDPKFYIEINNSSIHFLDTTYLDDNDATLSIDESELARFSKYSLSRINSSPSGFIPRAYTDIYSNGINIPSDFGPYFIKEKALQLGGSTIVPDFDSNPVQHPYEFQIKYQYNRIDDFPEVNLNWRGTTTFKCNGRLSGASSYSTGDDKWVRQELTHKFERGTINSSFSNSLTKKLNIPISKHIYSLNDINYRLAIQGDSPLNNYIYTGDIGETGHPKDYQYSDGLKVQKFVYYIQYTLDMVDAKLKIDGIYGPRTKQAVINFQTKYDLRFKDGIVGSETKAALAMVWQSLSDAELSRRLKAIPKNFDKPVADSILKFRELSEMYSTPENLLTRTDKAYKRISWTDDKAGPPDRIRDTIIFRLPTRLIDKDISRLFITPGMFGQNDIWKGIVIQQVRIYDSSVNLDCTEITHAQLKAIRNDSSKFKVFYQNTSNSINFKTDTITVGPSRREPMKGKWIEITVLGSSLNKNIWGTGEGIAIKEIDLEAYISVPDETENIPVTVTVNLDGTQKDTRLYGLDLNGANSEKIINPSNIDKYISSIQSLEFTIKTKAGKEIKVTRNASQLAGVTGRPMTFDDRKKLNVTDNDHVNVLIIQVPEVKLESTTLSGIVTLYAFIDDIKEFTNITTSLDSIVKHGTQYNINTSNVSITTTPKIVNSKVHAYRVDAKLLGNIYTTSTYNVSGHIIANDNLSTLTPANQAYLADMRQYSVTNQSVTSNKGYVTYRDGVVCLASQKPGQPISPFGFPDLSNVHKNPNATQDEAGNTFYGDFTLLFDPRSLLSQFRGNVKGNMKWGFYDVKKKEFLGRKLPYVEYAGRGPNNIFIGIQVGEDFLYDQDDQVNYNINVPLRLVCPVYAVRPKNNAAVQLVRPHSNLEKTDMWYFGVTKGSFSKRFTFPLNNQQYFSSSYNWLKNLGFDKGTYLTAIYDTTVIDNIIWSEVLGKPFVNTLNENPLIINDYSIRLKKTPFAVIHEPSNEEDLFGTPVKPYVKIYTRSSFSAPWIQVPNTNIQSFDASTGLIEFTSPLVPDDRRLIKVSYATRENYIKVAHIAGEEIPLNPMFNTSALSGKALFVYLVPNYVIAPNGYIINGSSNGTNIVKVTSDPNVFNPDVLSAYNPFATQIGTIYYVNPIQEGEILINDLRIKGGGIKNSIDYIDIVSTNSEYKNFWDIAPARGMAYNKGGFVIIRLPKELKTYIKTNAEIYDVIRSNLTAGVAFAVQDYDGNEWEMA